MKLIIALTGARDKGKTSTLVEVAKLLLDYTKYDKNEMLLNEKPLTPEEIERITRQTLKESIKNNEDFSLFLDIANWKIGIATAGDDIWTTRKNHNFLIKEKKCDIVILGIRRNKHAGSWKETVQIADNENYTIIETHPFENEKEAKVYNSIKGRRIFEIVKSLLELNDMYF